MPMKFDLPKEAIELYVERRWGDLRILREALQSHSSETFFRIGHSLKGNAVCFGFPELESIGESLETVSEMKDWTLAEALVEKFQKWCSKESASQHSERPIGESEMGPH